MLHACDQKFDMTENLKNFCELNKALWDKQLGTEACTRASGCFSVWKRVFFSFKIGGHCFSATKANS